ncbi:MAG: multicopper oxidase domain-containing protein [Planctomycetota bacterium]
MAVALLAVLLSFAREVPAQEGNIGQEYRSLAATAQSETGSARGVDRYSLLQGDLQGLNAAAETTPMKWMLDEGGVFREFVNPPSRSSSNQVLETQLKVAYAINQLWNPVLDKNIKVRLRAYEGGLVGPTLRVKPGDNLLISMENHLCKNQPHHGSLNVPHNFNTTNLHTHGLHVSPAGNSDNILVEVAPESSFRNEIYVPKDHPAGTFWYHGHVHGSTAIQVSSGMAGALIVEGGLDNIREIRQAAEHVLVFQQMPYRKSPRNDYYQIENYDDFGPGAWDRNALTTGWRTLVSGQTFPIFTMKPQEVMRWRMIHSGVREGIEPTILPYQDALNLVAKEIAANQAADKEQAKIQDIEDVEERSRRQMDLNRRRAEFNAQMRKEVDAAAVNLIEIAADGLAYGYKWDRKSIPLFPGYRSDVLVKIDTEGTYVIVDREVVANEALHGTDESPKLLGAILVSGETNAMDLPRDEDLSSLRPHNPIADAELDHGQLQKVEFNIDLDFNPPLFEINSKAFDPANMPRKLKLNTASEWILKSRFVNHPFHIHVNPFEITSIKDPEGNEKLPMKGGEPIPIWKDTILVREGYTIRARSRYERYIGKFVLHCHILDHEDQGMMELVEIVAGESHHGSH